MRAILLFFICTFYVFVVNYESSFSEGFSVMALVCYSFFFVDMVMAVLSGKVKEKTQDEVVYSLRNIDMLRLIIDLYCVIPFQLFMPS